MVTLSFSDNMYNIAECTPHVGFNNHMLRTGVLFRCPRKDLLGNQPVPFTGRSFGFTNEGVFVSRDHTVDPYPLSDHGLAEEIEYSFSEIPYAGIRMWRVSGEHLSVRDIHPFGAVIHGGDAFFDGTRLWIPPTTATRTDNHLLGRLKVLITFRPESWLEHTRRADD